MPEKACLECGKTFEYKASQPGRECCSTSCAGRLRNRRLKAQGRLYQPVKPRRGEERPCEVCGKPVYRNRGQAALRDVRYCSVACHHIAQAKATVIKVCARCGVEMRLSPSETARQFCSKACEGLGRTLRPLSRAHNGKPARLDADGYVLVWEPEHPNKAFKGWQYEHRLIAERVIGRYLRSDEAVHHLNHVKDDNRPENLEVMDALTHATLSMRDYREGINAELAELAEYRRRYGPLKET